MQSQLKLVQLSLVRGFTKSCGCINRESKSGLKVGDKVNRLTLLEYLIGKWKCKCDCGNEVIIKTPNLTSGNTKSCGCLKTDELKRRVNKLISGRRKFDPMISTARRNWQNIYNYVDKKLGFESLSFEEYLNLVKQNCFYCGIEPQGKSNYFKNKKLSSKYAIENGEFICNGLDRIDSKKHHSLDNCVSCCYRCNAAKNRLSKDEFLNKIMQYDFKEFKPIDIQLVSLPEFGPLKLSIKSIYETSYNDGNLTLEEFYVLSQKKCFYCNCDLSNSFCKFSRHSAKKTKELGKFIYNGLDRVDSNLPHNKDNVVPCCKYCNFAKSDLSLEEFYTWAKRLQEYQKRIK
jgi:hypothetical protein